MSKRLLEAQAAEFLEQNGGDLERYVVALKVQRPGQAFFNSLSQRHQNMLRGTEYDPFYDYKLIPKAIEMLKLWDEAEKRSRFNND